MISLEATAYIHRLLAARGIHRYALQVYALPLDPERITHFAPAYRGCYYLMSLSLPVGTVIASESSVLQITEGWHNKGITQLHEFTGQLTVTLPTAGAATEVEFLRAIAHAE